jgi:Protein of unknown function (DUF3105)
VSKKLEEKQRRRLAEEKKRAEMKRAQRRRNLVTTVIALVVAAGVVWLVLSDSTPRDSGVAKPLENGITPDEAGCGEVQDAEILEATHIAQGDEHPEYNTNPPTSGAHYAAPLAPIDTGFYSEPVEAEKVLHNMEHGQVAIWYSPDAPQETIDDIEQVTEQEPDATLAVPWEEIEEPSQFVLSAWGSLQECVQASQEVIDDFRTDFQGRGPEDVGVPTFGG